MNATDGGGADLLAPLREMDIDDSPPPGYDIAQAIRRGGTIRRRRITTGVIAAAVLVAVAAPALSRQTDGGHSAAAVAGGYPLAACTGRAISPPVQAGAYTDVIAAMIDPTGRYLVLNVARPDVPNFGAVHVALVDRRTNTTTMLPVDNGSAVGVNSSGTVVGVNDGPAQRASWVFDSSGLVALPSFDGELVTPTAINSRGDVVGTTGDDTGGGIVAAVISPAGSPRAVHALGGGRPSAASGITDDGTVGGSADYLGLSAPVVWNAAGQARMLSTNDDLHEGSVQAVGGPFAVGEVTAYHRAALWDLTSNALRVYPAKLVFLWVSPSGVAIGSQIGVDGAILAHDGQVWRLPDIDRLNSQIATGATADTKTIVGLAYSGHLNYALIWTC